MPGTARRRRAGARDRGASSVEFVAYTPVLMLVIFLTVQFALTWHGTQVAGAVAREAGRVARAGGGTPEAIAEAETRGVEYAEAIGGNALTDVDIEIASASDEEITVTVTGRSVEIVPGFAPRVHVSVQGPVEIFRPDV